MRKRGLAFTLILSIFMSAFSFQVFAQGSTSDVYIVLEMGENLQLRSMTSIGELHWSSYDNEVATVNNNGLVTAANIGAVRIFYENIETLQRGFMDILVIEEIDEEVPEPIIHRVPISIRIPADATSSRVPITTEFTIKMNVAQ